MLVLGKIKEKVFGKTEMERPSYTEALDQARGTLQGFDSLYYTSPPKSTYCGHCLATVNPKYYCSHMYEAHDQFVCKVCQKGVETRLVYIHTKGCDGEYHYGMQDSEGGYNGEHSSLEDDPHRQWCRDPANLILAGPREGKVPLRVVKKESPIPQRERKKFKKEVISPRSDATIYPTPRRPPVAKNWTPADKQSPSAKKNLFDIDRCDACKIETEDLKAHTLEADHKNFCPSCNHVYINIKEHLHKCHHFKYRCRGCPGNKYSSFFPDEKSAISHYRRVHGDDSRRTDDLSTEEYESVRILARENTEVMIRESKEAEIQKSLESIFDSEKERLYIPSDSREKPIFVAEVDLYIKKKRLLVEIKHWKSWKHAIGQIRVYLRLVPGCRGVIYFFGDPPCNELFRLIKELCQMDGIIIAWKPKHIMEIPDSKR